MMRASFIPRSPLLMLAAALVAVAALFPGGAPAEAQAPATVTRTYSTPDGDVHIQVRAGNYYKVLGIDDETLRASGVSRVYEGDLTEIVVAVGSLVGVPSFSCFTRPGTATESTAPGAIQSGESDYVSSGQNGFEIDDSKWVGNPGVITLPIVTKAEDVDPNASPPKENTLEPIEYFEVECLPQGAGGNLWRADGSARLRIEIIDQARDARLNTLTVKSSTDGTTFPTTLTLSPGFNNRYTEYSVLVGSAVTHVNVRPEGIYEGTTTTVNGVAVARGSTSDAIALTDGTMSGLLGYTIIEVQVTAVDGSTTRDHTVTVKKMPAAHLSDLEVLDEYGSLVTRPEFNLTYPGQAQIVFVAPGIRRVKVKPHWRAGSTMSVAVSTTAMDDNSTLSTATVTTSGTESDWLTLSSLGFGSTKLNISVTEGSTTTEYPKKYVTRNLNAANADNYLNSMGVSPNPNARASFSGQSYPGYYNVLHYNQGAADYLIRNISYQSAGPLPLWPPAFGYARVLPSDPYTPAEGLPRQNSGSITLTPAFDPYVKEYTATVPHRVTSVFVNLGLSHPKASATVNGNSPSTAVSLNVGENVVEVVVTAESGVQRTYTLTITREPSNVPPAVSSALADATIINESGTRQVSLSGVFTDADGDGLTVTASSSDENIATVSVSADYSTLTVSAKSRGTATITVNASDGKGGTVSDAFTVTVKSAPVVASAISDISGLEAGDSRAVSLSGAFSDADGDSLTIMASSSDNAKATVSVAADRSALTVSGVSEGTATINVTARDPDGNTVSDAFEVSVVRAPEPEPEPVELPGPVLGLELTATHDSVSVSWSAPESGDAPDGYIVNIKRQGGGDGETRRPGANKTSLTFPDLNSGSTYEVWVRAKNEAGKGERTHATITLPSVLPGPVTGLEVAATEDGVTVSWSAPETGGAPDGYIVHIRPEDGAEGSGRTKTPKAKKTQVSFDNLEAGRTYKVWVRAENEAGKGERVRAGITIPAAAEDGQTGQ